MRGLLPLVVALGACEGDATVRGITLRLEGQGLLDEVDELTLNVWDAAGLECRNNGELSGEPAGEAIVRDLSLTIGEQTSIDVPAGRRIFAVEAFAAGERLGVGCADETLEGGQTVEIEIAVHRLVCSSECGNGRLDCDEECEDGNVVAGDGCDAACESEEGNVPQNTDAAQLDAVAAGSTGGFFVMGWFDSNTNAGAPIRVTFRDAEGAKLEGGLGNDRDANAPARLDPSAPDVATSEGGSVAVWEDFSGTAQTVPDVKARFFDPTSRYRDSDTDVFVNVATEDRQEDPAAGMTSAGDALVVWRDDGLAPPGISGRRYDGGGEPRDADGLVVANDTDSSEPAVAGLLDGFAVAYRAAGIEVRLVPLAGDPGPAIATASGATAHDPAVAALEDGSAAMIVWVQGDGVYGQILGSDGTLGDDAIQISTEDAATPAVAGGDGVFAVVWETGGDVHGRLLDAAGEPLFNRISDDSGTFVANRATDDDQVSPAVAIIGDLMLTVWQDDAARAGEDDSPSGIRFRTFSVAGL